MEHVTSSFLTRDQTQPPALGAWSLSHWTTSGAPKICTLVKIWTSCERTVGRATNSTWGNWEGLPIEGYIWFMALKISKSLLSSKKEKGHLRQRGNMNQIRKTKDFLGIGESWMGVQR